MKRAIFSLAVVAMLLTSCNTTTKDSSMSINYGGFNLIVDTYDMSQPAIVSTCTYSAHTNLSKGVVDLKASDIIINNQKNSFETDTMALHYSTFKTLDGQDILMESFHKNGSVGVGSAVSNMNGYYSWHYFRYSGYQYSPEVSLTDPNYQIGFRQGLNMSYKLSDRYLVQTFNTLAQTFTSDIFYKGNSYANDETGSFSTKKTDYLIGLDFQNNVASLLIYNPEYSTVQQEDFPKIIMLEKIPIKFTHDRIYIESTTPTTKVLSTKDSKTEFVENAAFKASDFSLNMLSQDLTEVEIRYTINGKSVTFNGSNIVKAGK